MTRVLKDLQDTFRQESRSFTVSTKAPSIYSDQTSAMSIFKKEDASKASNVQARLGILPHPYNLSGINALRDVDTHHNTCMRVKVNATVGVGFLTQDEIQSRNRQVSDEMKLQEHRMKLALKDPDKSSEEISKQFQDDVMEAFMKAMSLDPMLSKSRADEVLDPLCEHSFQDLLVSAGQDFEAGNGYIEVKRNSSGRIVGLYHVSSEECFVAVEKDTGDFHYIVENGLESQGGRKHFARFGDKEDFIRRMSEGSMIDMGIVQNKGRNPEEISEIIHFKMPTNMSRFYGRADWLSAVANIELSKAVTQYKYDFYYNRGVPEFIAMISGGELADEDWNHIKESLAADQGTVGIQKRKTVVFNVASQTVKLQVEKIGAENMSDTFKDDAETIATRIVSAHGVPPLLANILIPGKMGSVNELPNALVAFQALAITQRQRIVSRTLISTLGDKGASGLDLEEKDFMLRKITDLLDIKTMDTVSRMRDPLAGSDRNPDDGLKD